MISRIANRSLFCSSRILKFRTNNLLFTFGTAGEKVETTSEDLQQTLSLEKFNNLQAENEKLSNKFKEIEDKYKRSLAEMENLRKRMDKQVDEAKLFGIQKFCKDLIEVSDVLSKASETIESTNSKDIENQFKQLVEGVKMTDEQLVKVFSKHGLVRINPKVGEKFNPNYHEAIFKAPLIDGKESDTVSVVTKVGYKIHERTLRPAYVGVFC